MIGANQGKEFGTYYRNDLKSLKKINDFDWLREQFEKTTDAEDI
jgi:hypothetical protein